MAVYTVDLLHVADDKGHAAHVLRQFLIEVFFNHHITAEPVGNAGQRIFIGGVGKFVVLFSVGKEKREIQENENERQAERTPEEDAEHRHGHIICNCVENVLVRKDQDDRDHGHCKEKDQLYCFVKTVHFHIEYLRLKMDVVTYKIRLLYNPI